MAFSQGSTCLQKAGFIAWCLRCPERDQAFVVMTMDESWFVHAPSHPHIKMTMSNLTLWEILNPLLTKDDDNILASIQDKQNQFFLVVKSSYKSLLFLSFHSLINHAELTVLISILKVKIFFKRFSQWEILHFFTL